MSPARAADVARILAQHGIDPDADAETLTTLLQARGWTVMVGETSVGMSRRYTAHATRTRDPPHPEAFPIIRHSVRATRASPRTALAFVLAKALEKEHEA